MSPEQLAVMIPIIALCIPITAIWTKHRQEMERIKAMGNQQSKSSVSSVPNNVAAELNALREEVASLRETTTRFDMSFDAALSRVEQRVDKVEEKQAVTTPQWQAAPQEEPVVVRQGR